MKGVVSILFLSLLNFNSPSLNDSANIDELKIARAMRKAVRTADSTLLKSTLLGNWRDYLKISTVDLEVGLQPLVLIKFDEDMGFRNQLKSIIEWQCNWQQKETEHFIYYYRWDQPPLELVLEIQEIHFKELARLFKIDPPEKIPFRYDPTAEQSMVFPYTDLRGGVVSPQPFDLEKTALAFFYFINSEPCSILEPLTRLYGSYFQDRSTSETYFQHCMLEIKKNGYISAGQLYQRDHFEKFSPLDWFSSYAFVYSLNHEFGPVPLAEFLSKVNYSMPVAEFQSAFEETFGVALSEFENRYQPQGSVSKM